jgi:integrase
MNIGKKRNKKGDKYHFFYDLGRGKGGRQSLNLFIYTKPRDQLQRTHNKETLKIIETKKGQAIIEQQSIGTPFIPSHKFKENFLEYYDEYVTKYSRKGNRHLKNSLTQFKEFIKKDFIAPLEITEKLCKAFRQHLLDKYTGETPSDYFSRFKQVISEAKSDKYFLVDPCEKIPAISNASKLEKEIIEAEDYIALLRTPIIDREIMVAFIFCCYTGLRACDIRRLQWHDFRAGKLFTKIIQKKTGKPLTLVLHPIANAILSAERKICEDALGAISLKSKIFHLPSQNQCNTVLNQWVFAAKIKKKITWSCARLSFSVLLQDAHIDDATVAALLGHTTTKQVQKIYKRARPKVPLDAVSNLPLPEEIPALFAGAEDDVLNQLIYYKKATTTAKEKFVKMLELIPADKFESLFNDVILPALLKGLVQSDTGTEQISTMIGISGVA